MASSILTSFLGALQASLSVLLTIFYGAIAAQYKLLSESSTKQISKTCVDMFLPALLIHNVGSQLRLETGIRYVPILIYSISYNVLSIALGIVTTRVFKLPSWVTPAIAFNNTTSLPLLLVQSFEAAGILNSLLGAGESSSDAVDRAKSYFLVNSLISNTLTFALGPKLLHGQAEESPEDHKKDDASQEEPEAQSNGADNHNNDNDDDANEQTSLLPDRIRNETDRVEQRISAAGHKRWSQLSPRTQTVLDFLYQFLNAPLIGAVIGAIIGLTPGLHTAFFAKSQQGGIFNAWLMSSIKNIGDLFASLQIIVVGVKLASAMQRMKAGKASGSLPWSSFAFVTFIRFIIWPLISIPLIWVLATKTSVLTDDPVLWFAMMLMPTGPPALKLTALADVSGADDDEKMSIAKFLTASYLISPLICFSVVGSLKASEAAM